MRSSFYMHMWNRLQGIKSVKMVLETSDKNQYSYFYILTTEKLLSFLMPRICQFRMNEDLIRIINCERGRRERTRSSFYMHIWNSLQRIKSLKMVVDTSDKNQFSYFYILSPFLERKNIAQLFNVTHLLVFLIRYNNFNQYQILITFYTNLQIQILLSW